MKLAALSVDLDEIPCYHAIHGLAPAREDTAHAVYRRAVPRLRELLADLRVPCTFFVIGSDVADANAAEQLRALHREGHELANHTMNHRYDFVRLGESEIRAEIADGADAIERACGVRPVGFRAPGYTITDEVFDALVDASVAYDSSVFPCPAYFGAKVSAIALIRLRGRRSHSIVDTPAVLTAPGEPYVPGRPYWRRGDAGPIELPIGVTRGTRLPYIGTSVMMAGPRGARWLTRMVAGRSLVNLELHGLDLLDAHADDLGILARHQRDLAIPLERKLASLRAVVQTLADRGYRFVTLADAAAQARAAS